MVFGFHKKGWSGVHTVFFGLRFFKERFSYGLIEIRKGFMGFLRSSPVIRAGISAFEKNVEI